MHCCAVWWDEASKVRGFEEVRPPWKSTTVSALASTCVSSPAFDSGVFVVSVSSSLRSSVCVNKIWINNEFDYECATFKKKSPFKASCRRPPRRFWSFFVAVLPILRPVHLATDVPVWTSWTLEHTRQHVRGSRLALPWRSGRWNRLKGQDFPDFLELQSDI